MAKTTGAGSYLAIYNITGAAFGTLLYLFDQIETSAFANQASGLLDFTIVDQAWDAAYRTALATALPFDPAAGAEAQTDPGLENGTAASAGSGVIPTLGYIYVGPYNATDNEYVTFAGLIKFDRSSADLATTGIGKTNKATAKLIGQKPSETITIDKDLYPSAILTVPVADTSVTTTVLVRELVLDGV